MFANMYATQAILPEIEHGLDVSPSAAGLSITVVVLGVAFGGWVHGPLSDRVGRAREPRERQAIDSLSINSAAVPGERRMSGHSSRGSPDSSAGRIMPVAISFA